MSHQNAFSGFEGKQDKKTATKEETQGAQLLNSKLDHRIYSGWKTLIPRSCHPFLGQITSSLKTNGQV